MTAQEFWNDFKEIFKDGTESKKQAIELWYDYTNFILDQISGILRKNGLETQKEFYRADIIGYKELRKKANEKVLGFLKKSLWSLEVAIEHENEDTLWMQEITKIMNLYCPLRIVICYLPYRYKNNHLEFLSEINNCISVLSSYNNLQNGEFMIIIGDSKCKGDNKTFCHYTPYVFRKSGFEQLL